LHALCVLDGSEDVDVVAWGAKCFHAFVALLAVVKPWRHAVDAEEWILDELGLRPFARLDAVAGFNMAIDWEVSQRLL